MKLPVIRALLLPIILVGVASILIWINYQPGTWLSGWDTLHPEFNLTLYFKRAFFSLWQEHQGLGALATQTHASELPRLSIIYLLSFFLPRNLIRYGYFSLTLILGPLGVYYFSKYLIKNKFAALVAGLFFLLNLTTLQHFYLPLEMFATLFASIGWLFLFSSEFLQKGKKKSLIAFALTVILATPMSHTPTLFFAFLLCFLSYLLAITVLNHQPIKRLIVIGVTTLLLNSFWLIPSLYFIVDQGSLISQSKIHQQFSSYAFSYSHKFGNLNNIVQLKNFLFDWGEFDDFSNQFITVFNEWLPHLNNPPIRPIAYLIFSLMLIGLTLAIIKKNRYVKAMVLPLFISFSFIANNVVFFEKIFSLLSKRVPLFQEALRFPFTKFSTIMVFSWAIFIGYSISTVRRKLWQFLFSIAIVTLLLIQMWPAFKGNLISPSMKVNFPKEYFEVMTWLNLPENQGRIAHFPVHTFRGWSYYRWQYEGAGFWWFGLDSPFLDREFDRWSPYSNENFFWEISNAIYSKNLKSIEAVFDKYQVRWVLVDKNIFDPSSNRAPSFEIIDELFTSSDKISLVRKFNDIGLYQYSPNQKQGVVSLISQPKNIGPQYNWSDEDVAFEENGHYITDQSLSWEFYYPYRTLFTKKAQGDLEFDLGEDNSSFILQSQIEFSPDTDTLIIPKNYSQSYYNIAENDLTKINYQTPEISIQNDVLYTFIPKIKGEFSQIITPQAENINAQNCRPDQDGQVNIKKVATNNRQYWQLSATNAYNCGAIFWLPTLPQNISYIISIEHQHQEGETILFWLENLQARKADIETYLPKSTTPTTSYFIQPLANPDGLGYGLHFDNIAIDKKTSTNLLGQISLYPFPLEFLSHLKVLSPNKKGDTNANSKAKITNIRHPNSSIYQVKLESNDGNQSTIIWLPQTYHNGWQAYPIKNTDRGLEKYLASLFSFLFKKPLNHLLVNNWANGWQLEENLSGVVIYFTPQLLQYFGILLTVIWILIIIFSKRKYY
jgi:hypothetical protein